MPLKTALYMKSATMRWPRKQKHRDTLSINMISLPLGDFRHLSHIGLDTRGDAFGDLAAFQRSNSLILHSSHSHHNLFQTATLPPPPKPPRLLSPEEMEAQAITKPKARLKSHSLPLLDAVDGLECDKLPKRQEEAKMVEQGVEKAGLRMRSEASKLDGTPPQAPCPNVDIPVAEEDPSFTLSLDLGPSILEDVLQVMDRLLE